MGGWASMLTHLGQRSPEWCPGRMSSYGMHAQQAIPAHTLPQTLVQHYRSLHCPLRLPLCRSTSLTRAARSYSRRLGHSCSSWC